MKTAEDFVSEIRANVDDWYAGGCDYNIFHVRQVAIWDAVYAAGKEVSDRVQGIIRASLKMSVRA